MKKAIWISYDLGVRGDYEGMYAWLDEHHAKECGDSLAFLNYEFKTDLMKELKAALSKAVDLKPKRTRIYVIHLDSAKKMKGTFLLGGRKSPPWAGYASESETEEDVDEI